MSEDGLCPIELGKLSIVGCFWQLYVIPPYVNAAQYLFHFYTTFIIILLTLLVPRTHLRNTLPKFH